MDMTNSVQSRTQSESRPPLIARLLREAGPLRQLRGWPRLVDALCPQQGGERYRYDVDFFGLRYKGHLGSFIDRQAYFFDAYESEALHFVRAWAASHPAGVALDIGANVGHHSLAFSRMFETVHAFEPNPGPLALLRQRTEENRLSNLSVHGFGLWDSDAELTFNLPPSANTGMGSFKETIAGMGPEAVTRLPVRRGDDVLEASGIMRIDFLKIDVQGAECEVLTGLERTLSRSHPLAWVEISETTRADFPTLGSLVERLGGKRFEPLGFTRRWPWLNLMTPHRVDEAAFKSIDGNLLLRPV